jgi:hypothetical protein
MALSAEVLHELVRAQGVTPERDDLEAAGRALEILLAAFAQLERTGPPDPAENP